MRKLVSILVALGVVLSFSLMAAPAAAVEEPITVCLEEEVACQSDNYTIAFHNVGTLMATDWIDIMFPPGTNAFFVSGVSVTKGAKKSAVMAAPPACYCSGGAAVTTTYTKVSNTTIRVILSAGQNITKCDWVCITVNNVTNPASCNYHLEVGTTTHTPVDSEEYTIYCAKVALVGGPPVAGISPMNLISLPCYPDDEAIEVVLKELYDKVVKTANDPEPFSFSVWYWDNESDKWLKYVSDTSFNDLTTIEPGKAYWVKPSAAVTVKIHGDPYPPGQGPPIKWCYPRCWNMVGFASLVSMNATDYLKYAKLPPSFTGDAILAIWSWNEVLQVYYDENWGPSGFMMTPGKGYWMAFFDEACIIPPAQSTC